MSRVKKTDLLDARIRQYYESIPPSEKPLADLLLTFPGDITDYSATELCEKANTSKAAASRFFSRIGYKDFNDARLQAREAKKWGAPLYQSSSQYQTEPSTSDTSVEISEHILTEQANLARTLESIKSDDLTEIANELRKVKRVRVIGYRNNHFLASYFSHQLSLVRNDVTLHPQANQTIAEELFDLSQDDLVVVFGVRRRTQLLENVLKLAKNKGCQTLLIADPTANALHKYTTWKFDTIVHSTSTFDSYTCVMSAITLLVNRVIADNSEYIERLSAIESAHEVLGELDSV